MAVGGATAAKSLVLGWDSHLVAVRFGAVKLSKFSLSITIA